MRRFLRDNALMFLVLAIAIVVGSLMFARAAEPVVIGYRQVCDGQTCRYEPIYGQVPATVEVEEFVKATKAPAATVQIRQMAVVRVPEARFPVAHAAADRVRDVAERQPVRRVAERAANAVRAVTSRLFCRCGCR